MMQFVLSIHETIGKSYNKQKNDFVVEDSTKSPVFRVWKVLVYRAGKLRLRGMCFGFAGKKINS